MFEKLSPFFASQTYASHTKTKLRVKTVCQYLGQTDIFNKLLSKLEFILKYKCEITTLLSGSITFWFSSISALSSEETTVFVMALQK